jgi:PAS domain S-box-containing protein
MPVLSAEPQPAEAAEKGRILIVDDDQDFAEGLDILLAAEGYAVEVARTPEAAMQALESFAAEVALVDIRLAGSSGLNLIAQLHLLRPGVLCVMMTAFASADTAIQALQEGAYDYLQKPFHSSDLMATLGRCFERLDLEREKAAVDAALRARNQELERINKRLQRVVHGMRDLTSYVRTRDLVPRVLEEVARNMAADGGSVYLREDQELVLKHTLDPGHAPQAIALPLKQDSVFGRAMNSRQPVLLNEIGQSREVLPSGWTGYDDSSLLAFPMLGEDGEEIGVLSLHAKAEPPFTEQDRDIGLILISFACETIRAVQALEDLAESEERFRSLVEASPICIQEMNLSGRLTSMNQAGLDLLGLDGKAAAKKLDYLGLVAAADRGRVRATLDRVRSGAPASAEYAIDLERGTRLVASAFAPLVNPSGAVHRVMAITQDVTEPRQAEEQLRQAQKMEAVGQLTGGVAHDFNNLLAVILGNTELMTDLLGKGSDLSRYLEAVSRAADRGAELTQRLLAFSRRQPLRPQVTDLPALVDGMTGMLGRTLGETIEIETRGDRDIWAVLADPGQVENALLNLAINARDAMPDGGRLTIEIANAALGEDIQSGDQGDFSPGQYVVVTVGDTGIGMAPEVLEHAFEPFFTTKRVGEGSGLGLSMVYGFAKQSHGHVTIESTEGQGTTVKLYLPRAEAANEEAAPEVTSAEPRGRGERILVVEDDPEVLSLAVSLLESLGYEVVTAKDGGGAIGELATLPRVDLLLSDVVLPGGMSGPDLADQVRHHAPEIKVLFMSGYAEVTGSYRKLLDSGSDLLDKPFHKRELAQKVRALLDPG